MALMANSTFDVVIAGGGLSGLLTAYWIRKKRPAAIIALVEPSAGKLGGRLQSGEQGGVRFATGDSTAKLQANQSAVTGSGIDLGGAWVWLHQNPALRQLLVDELNLKQKLVAQVSICFHIIKLPCQRCREFGGVPWRTTEPHTTIVRSYRCKVTMVSTQLALSSPVESHMG
eukprot:TRINITY_DN16835_c0_g1_i1.p1 TRINITY_DN16835_c0_g1~~TRINITY_DN16835_c0_g1_i1.p1  ORF type:complete len:172 (-),score=13.10 TRINITY_DN16835_c0_g1_i1:120-635(-)